MTIGAYAPSKATTDGTGGTFAFGFRIFAASELRVTHSTEGVLSAARYVVNGQQEDGSWLNDGGSITFLPGQAPVAGALTIEHAPSFEQQVGFRQIGTVDLRIHETAFDRVTRFAQLLLNSLNRTVRRAAGSTSTADLTLPEPEAGRAIIWNDAADGIANGPSVGDIANAASNATTATTKAGEAVAARDIAVAAAASAAGAVAGALQVTNALSEFASDPAAARTNLGAASTVDVAASLAALDARVSANSNGLLYQALLRAMDQGAYAYSMPNGFADEFEDTSGVDATASTGESYDASGDYYASGAITLGTDLVPDMTGVSTPSGTVIFSTQNASYPAWKVFDDSAVAGDGWLTTGSASGYVGYDFGVATTVRGFSLKAPSSAWDASGPGSAPGMFTIEGSDEGSAWAVIQSYNQTGWTNYEKRTFTFSAPQTYRYFRLNGSSQSGARLGIDELEFLGGVGPDPMALVSNAFAAVAEPVSARAVVLVEPIDAVTLNTDLVCEISRDDGTSWAAGTLAQETTMAAVLVLGTGEIDLTGQPSGTDMRIRLRTPNGDAVKVHGWAVQWY